MTPDGAGGPASIRQGVRAEGGYAYGAVGADIHVFGNGTPVYLLFAHRRVSGLDSDWLRAQPSRMLDARAEVVDFTGRDAGTYWDVAERYSGYIPHLRFALSVLADLLDAVGEHADAAEFRRKRETIPDPGV